MAADCGPAPTIVNFGDNPHARSLARALRRTSIPFSETNRPRKTKSPGRPAVGESGLNLRASYGFGITVESVLKHAATALLIATLVVRRTTARLIRSTRAIPAGARQYEPWCVMTTGLRRSRPGQRVRRLKLFCQRRSHHRTALTNSLTEGSRITG